MSRLIAVGDIHGRYTELRDLLDHLDLGRGDEIVFLGDFVDYGPQSADVIEYLIDTRKFRKSWFLMGNHDAWFLEYLESGYADPNWYKQGGKETLDSYGPSRIVPREHRDFLQLLSRPIKIEKFDVEYVFSHGILCPTKPIETRFDRSDALWGRPSSFDWDSFAWGGNQFLVFGHTAHRSPTFYGKSLCIDTGAKVEGRALTAAILPSSRWGKIEFINSNGESPTGIEAT